MQRLICKEPNRLLVAAALLTACAPLRPADTGVQFWLTKADGSAKFARQPDLSAASSAPDAIITVDENKRYQSMEGFGFSLTGGSALLIHKMSPAARAKLLKELFSPEDGIGISYLRISVGASDLDERVFSYDDLAPGQADPNLEKFSLAPDRAHLIPVLKEILALQPRLRLMATPWSAPSWMKDNGSPIGGSLRRELQASYAAYQVKYLQQMKAEGITIDAITIQNEPLNPKNNPSMSMTAAQQTVFLRDYLGPALARARLPVNVLLYDHNADRIDYPLEVLSDPAAARYAAGSAFHLYDGKVEDLTKVHDAHPDKDLYFTEQALIAPSDSGDLAWHMDTVVIGAPRNWCRTALEWNLASGPGETPHTDQGGCIGCLGAVSLDGDKVTHSASYYLIAHASKFVRPGSLRIASDEPEGFHDVAFRTPDGRFVLIAHNAGKEPRTVGLRQGGRTFALKLDAGAVGTVVWR